MALDERAGQRDPGAASVANVGRRRSGRSSLADLTLQRRQESLGLRESMAIGGSRHLPLQWPLKGPSPLAGIAGR
jgi:hypothetical protein